MTVYLTHCFCNLLGFRHLIQLFSLGYCQLGCLMFFLQLLRHYLSFAPHPGRMCHPKIQKVLSDSTESFWGNGDGRVPSGFRIPFPLVQGYAYGRDDRSALSVVALVPPLVAEAPARVSTFFRCVHRCSDSSGCCGGSGACC